MRPLRIPLPRLGLTNLQRRALLASLVLAFIAAFVVLVAGSSNPRVCSACHQSQHAALEESVHKGQRCYSCHLDAGPWSIVQAKTDEFFDMYPSKVFPGDYRDPGIRTSRGACASCHRNVIDKTVESKGLRINHAACAKDPARCDRCHSGVAHPASLRWERISIMDDCVLCHEQNNVSNACDLCHEGRLRIDRIQSGPWQVTHGARWRATHGMGKLETCRTCHKDTDCMKCHVVPIPHPPDFLPTHGPVAIKEQKACMSCHLDRRWCDACHGVDMPHDPIAFLPAHPRIAKTTADPICTNCHDANDCRRCHTAHVHPSRTDGTLKSLMPGTGGAPR